MRSRARWGLGPIFLAPSLESHGQCSVTVLASDVAIAEKTLLFSHPNIFHVRAAQDKVTPLTEWVLSFRTF